MEKDKVVIIEVSGGVADVTHYPDGITVIIVDHDNLEEGFQSYCPNCGEFYDIFPEDGICDECGFDVDNPLDSLDLEE